LVTEADRFAGPGGPTARHLNALFEPLIGRSIAAYDRTDLPTVVSSCCRTQDEMKLISSPLARDLGKGS